MDGGRKCCDRQTCPTQKQQLPSSEQMYTPKQWSQPSSRQDAMQNQCSPTTRSAERSCPARYANARNNSTQILFVEPNFMETPSEYDVFYDCFSDYNVVNESSTMQRVPREISKCPDSPTEIAEPRDVPASSPSPPNASGFQDCNQSQCPVRLPDDTAKSSETPEKRVSKEKEKDKEPSLSNEVSSVKQKDLSTMLRNLEDPQSFRGTLKQIVCNSHKLLKTLDEAIKKGKLKKCNCKLAVGNSQRVLPTSDTTPCSAAQAAPVQTALVNPVQAPCSQPISGQLQVCTGVGDGFDSATKCGGANSSAPEPLTLTIPVTIHLQYSNGMNAQSPKICAAPEMQIESMEPIRTAIISASKPLQPMNALEYHTGDTQTQPQPTNNIFQCPASKMPMPPEPESTNQHLNSSCHCMMCQAQAAQKLQYPSGCQAYPTQENVPIESPHMHSYACSLHQAQENRQAEAFSKCPQTCTLHSPRIPQQTEPSFNGGHACTVQRGPPRIQNKTETPHICGAKPPKAPEMQHTCSAKMPQRTETPCQRFQPQGPQIAKEHTCGRSAAPKSMPTQPSFQSYRPQEVNIRDPCDEEFEIDHSDVVEKAPASCPCQGLDDVRSIMNDKRTCNCGVRPAPKQQTPCTCQVLDAIKSVMKDEVRCSCNKNFVDPTTKPVEEVQPVCAKPFVPCTCHALEDVKSPMKDEKACTCEAGIKPPAKFGEKPEVPPKPRRLYRLALPQHRELKLCTPCRYEPSPLIDEQGNVFCPYKCGCCLCPWKPRATDSQIDRLNHQKIKVCKCRDRGTLFEEFVQKDVDCSKTSFFDVCPCREKAEAKYLELYGHEMWTADKLNTKSQGREISLAEVTEIIPFTRPKP